MTGLGQPFQKKTLKKVKKKTVKIEAKMPQLNKKKQSEFLFIHRFLTLRKNKNKKFTPRNHSFLLHFLFWHDQNHRFNLNSKIMKMCEQIFEKYPEDSEIKSKYNSAYAPTHN